MTDPRFDEPGNEQLHRLAEVWRESAPSEFEILRLRSRLGRRVPTRRAPLRAFVVALSQGVVLGTVTLATAAWVVGRPLPFLGGRTQKSAEQSPRPRGKAGVAEHRGEQAPASVATAPAPRAAFPEPLPAQATSGAPPAAEVSRKMPARAPSESATPMDPDGTPPPAPATAVDGPWARVARALSSGDWTSADHALSELTLATDPTTRDAATLARAELLIAHGQGSTLRPSVVRLAESGATALIRRRAARLLERLPSD